MPLRLFWLAQAAFLCLVLWSGYLLYSQANAMQGGLALVLDPGWFVATAAIKSATVAISALKFRESCLIVGLRTRATEWFGLSVIPTFHAYLSPAQTGHVLRAVYLRKRHDFEYPRYIALTLAVTLLEMLAAALVGFILSAILGFGTMPLRIFFTAALACLLAVPPLVWLAAGRAISWAPQWLENVRGRITRSAALLITRPAPFARLSLLCGASVIARWLGLYGSFKACGFDVGVMEVLIIESVRTIAGTVNITPANIGIAEGLIAGTGALLGIPPSQAVPAAVISRLIAMGLYVSLGLWFTKRLFGKLLFPAKTSS